MRGYEAVVRAAQDRFDILYPPTRYKVSWEDLSWDLAPVDVQGEKRRRIIFTYHRKDGGAPLPAVVANLAKAYIIDTKTGPSKGVSLIGGIRVLVSILKAGGVDGSAMLPMLANSHLALLEDRALTYLGTSSSTAAIYLPALLEWVRWLQTNRLLPPHLDVELTVSVDAPVSISDEDKARRAKRIVDREFIEALAAVYRAETDPRYRLLICAVGLLLVAGFRVSELVSLPANCLGHDVHRGQERYFLRFWQRKPGKAARLEMNKRWLSPLGAEFALELIEEIIRITEPFRAAARQIVEADGRVRVRFVPEDREWLSEVELRRAVSAYSGPGLATVIAREGIRSVCTEEVGLEALAGRRHGVVVYCRSDVEDYLTRLQGPLANYAFRSKSGLQTLPDALFVVGWQYFDRRKRTSEFVVEALRARTVHDFLDGSRTLSPLAAHLKGRTHGFRHWLHTVANKAGMSAFHLAVWMQRADMRHVARYLHDPVEVAELAREADRRGLMVQGGVNSDSVGPPSAEGPSWLDDVEMAHMASSVICALDLPREDCPEEKLCELCTKGGFDITDPEMLKRAKARRAVFNANVARLERLTASGIPIQEKMMDDAAETIRELDIRIALAEEYQSGLAVA